MFKGELGYVRLDVANGYEGQFGGYRRPMIVTGQDQLKKIPGVKAITNELIELPGVIAITNEFVDWISEFKTQREQILAILKVLLHEMCHQYCYENNIDDTDHNANWQRVAKEHGLHSVYEDGKPITEWIDSFEVRCLVIELRIC